MRSEKKSAPSPRTVTSKSPPLVLPLLLAAAGASLLLRKLRRSLRRIDFCGRTVLISGGSRGLGLELGRQFAREGARVALLARDPDELERARALILEAGGDVITLSCDITDRDQVELAVAAILESRGCIDVLINNAGIIQVAPFENMGLDDFRESVDVHAWGPLYLIRAVAPHMQRRRFGRIVNISSIGGLVAVPHLLPYTMGKFALTGLSDGFRAELAKDGVFVTTVAPGLMRTGSHVNAIFRGQHRKEFAWFAISAGNTLLSTSAPQAAAKIVEACRCGDPRLIITFPARLLHVVNSLFPGMSAFGTGLAGRLLPKPARPGKNVLHTGSESGSFAAPSVLTKPADRAIEPNNER
jgi:NAD(P)-dependent dehydrogenase (short-subunit alcohol dehydrogenase family)